MTAAISINIINIILYYIMLYYIILYYIILYYIILYYITPLPLLLSLKAGVRYSCVVDAAVAARS